MTSFIAQNTNHTARRLASVLLPLILNLSAPLATGQGTADSVTVVPAPEYANTWPFGLMFGGIQNSLWLTPLRLALVNPATYAGGLTPDYEVIDPDGGTLVLHAVNGDTVYFSPLRQIVKEEDVDPRDRRLLPTHPSGALVADALGAAAGLSGWSPKLVWFSEDSVLGDFRTSFGGVPGFLTHGQTKMGPPAAQRIDSHELFRVLDADGRNAVDPEIYLTCRFIDLLTGDWERSPWKWHWLPRTTGTHTVFTPLPLLHRQAFISLGFFSSTAHSALIPGFVNYSAEMGSVRNTVATAAMLDKRILTGVDRRTWDSAATAFAATISDSVIDAAVRRLPAEHFQLVGDRVVHALRSRRDNFQTIAGEFYRSLAEYMDLTLSNAGEYVIIERQKDGSVDVSAWQRTSAPLLLLHRRFVPHETEEIRVFCLGGNDTVMVKGEVEKSITLRINGGPGDDVLGDDSLVRGRALGFITWIATSVTMTYLYDHEGNNTIHRGSSTDIDDSPPKEFSPPGRFF